MANAAHAVGDLTIDRLFRSAPALALASNTPTIHIHHTDTPSTSAIPCSNSTARRAARTSLRQHAT